MSNRKKRAAVIRDALDGRSIVMVGMMGCGKSAIGKRLAQALDLPFVDADEEIEKAAGKSIAEIFAEHGEPHFRDGERKVIARLLGGGPQVLATGGGAFMEPRTRAAVRTHGVSVWLNADIEVLIRRVARRDNRPLLKATDPARKMRELLEQRTPFYAEADLTIESRDVAHDTIIDEIIQVLATGPALLHADRRSEPSDSQDRPIAAGDS
ncbi:MAG: shikimate kinase [Pseudomonadota bacterium]